MKSKLKISVLSLCCVAFGAPAMDAMAAPMVRTLGGAGTYSGTVSAIGTSSGSGAVTSAARAGTLSTTSTKSDSSLGTSSRLSIGKYLGSGASLKNGTTIKNPSTTTKPSSSGSDFNAADLDALNKRIDGLDDQIGKVDDKISDHASDVEKALDAKQDVLTGVDYIYVENNEIGLDLDALAADLDGKLTGGNGDGTPGQDGADGREVEMQATATEIQWRYAGEPTWRTLITLDELRTDGGVDAETLQAAVDAAVAVAVANFVTSAQVETIVTELTKDFVTGDELTSATENLVTKTQLDELKETMSGTLGREVQLQATATEIQWRYAGDEAWTKLIDVESLRGPAGDKGEPGTVDETVLTNAINTAIQDIQINLMNIDGAPTSGTYVPVVDNGETKWWPVVE